jgi:hypothetical protein
VFIGVNGRRSLWMQSTKIRSFRLPGRNEQSVVSELRVNVNTSNRATLCENVLKEICQTKALNNSPSLPTVIYFRKLILKSLEFKAFSRNYEKRILALSCLPVLLSVRLST